MDDETYAAWDSKHKKKCEHCTRKAVTTENGTRLCQKHLNEYIARGNL